MAGTGFFALFTDVGGVLGTNGWDTPLRRKICHYFALDFEDIERRHHLMFDSYERGFRTFEDYLQHVFFAEPRPFYIHDVREFAFAESIAWPDNIAFFGGIKQRNALKLGVISNEGEGLTGYRVRTWGLRRMADFLIFSCCVKLRKPDPAIWRLALDLAQAEARECIYIDDRPMFADIAGELGFTAIQHKSLQETKRRLEALGLEVPAISTAD